MILLAAGGSLALLLGAWGFQYLGGLAPCAMCIWQRWPHAVAAALGPVGLAIPGAMVPVFGALAALCTAAIGLYHTGVERGWWEGPNSCTSGSIEGLSTDELLNQILEAPLVQCDQVAWEFLGLSMASWNALASLALALIWIAAARARRTD